MKDSAGDRVAFVTLAQGPGHVKGVLLLEQSLRMFGGSLGGCHLTIYQGEPGLVPEDMAACEATDIETLQVPRELRGYPFASKVCACAQAEGKLQGSLESLVWMSHDTMILAPPVLLDLEEGTAAAVRPVHIRNIGLPVESPLDDFWRHVYTCAGTGDVTGGVNSFVEGTRIRPYFNSHMLSVRTSADIFRRWLDRFAALIEDRGFQEGPCSDDLHRIFLHQAVLSAVISTLPGDGQVRVLPDGYGYPYNLHGSVPPDMRAAALNDLVSIAYEDRSLNPSAIEDVEVREPLRSWLSSRRELTDDH